MQFKDVIGHEELKQGLNHEIQANRVSHAQLFTGPEGTGKLQLAIAFIQRLFCENPSENDSCAECSSCKQIARLEHPDLHFSFPVVLSKANHVESSDDRLTEWKELFSKQTYFSLHQWLEHLEELGKNPVIGKGESQKIQQKLSLTSFTGTYKVMIIWQADKLNITAANKLLKLIEEPPPKTIFILTTSNPDFILPTIMSRTQVVKVPALSAEEVEKYLLSNYNLEATAAHSISVLSNGSIAEAMNLMQGGAEHDQYFELFVQLMRAAYSANPMELMDVSESLASLQKEEQKTFIRYGLRIFRESIIFNYLKGKLTNLKDEEQAFLDKFARFINNQNITELHDEFNRAHYGIERNANAKILFSDLVIRLTKLIKKGV